MIVLIIMTKRTLLIVIIIPVIFIVLMTLMVLTFFISSTYQRLRLFWETYREILFSAVVVTISNHACTPDFPILAYKLTVQGRICTIFKGGIIHGAAVHTGFLKSSWRYFFRVTKKSRWLNYAFIKIALFHSSESVLPLFRTVKAETLVTTMKDM